MELIADTQNRQALSMDAKQVIEAYERSGELGAELRVIIASPSGRQQIYELLQGKALRPFHALILAMFEQEVLFTEALWERKVEAADEDSVSAIYRCAFFLYQIGDPDDVFVLWHAQRLNMDVGSILGVQYLVGAGINETIAFLERSDRGEAGKILEEIKNSFDDTDALDEQRRWDQARRADPDNVLL